MRDREMRVGVDIGGTKMLMLAQSEADCANIK